MKFSTKRVAGNHYKAVVIEGWSHERGGLHIQVDFTAGRRIRGVGRGSDHQIANLRASAVNSSVMELGMSGAKRNKLAFGHQVIYNLNVCLLPKTVEQPTQLLPLAYGRCSGVANALQDLNGDWVT